MRLPPVPPGPPVHCPPPVLPLLSPLAHTQPAFGFVPSLGLPHCEFAWRVRLLPAVRQVFAGIFGLPPEDLVVGEDLTVRWRWSG